MKIFNNKIKTEFVILTLFSFMVILCSVLQPLISQNLLDETLSGNFEKLPVQFIYLMITIIVLLCFELGRKMISANYKKNIIDSLRNNVLKGLLSKRLEEFQVLNNQKYVSLFNNDLIEITDNYYIQFTDILFNLIGLIVYAIALFNLNYIMAIIIVITNILPILAPLMFKKKLQLKKREYLEGLKKYNVKLGDVINGFSIIKVHRMKYIMENLLQKESSNSTDKEKSFNYVLGFSEMLVGLLSFTNYFLIILAGIYLMTKGELTAGGLLAAIQVSELMVGPTVSITYQTNSFNAVKEIKNSIFKEYGTNCKKSSRFEMLSNPIDEIEIKNLTFHYGDAVALDGINLTIKRNKKYLIFGQSGSGKSTLFKIMSRMYNNYEGQILINGSSLKEIKEEDYFSKIGIVYQTAFIFNDTLLENVTLYKDCDKRKVEKLITELDLIRIKDEIYSGKIFKDSENNLSGGEKQKISLARILYENKSFIFLDEATSSIDLKSSRKIESDLLTKPGITLVNIEHKINPETVSFYDEIVCLENGKVEKIIKSPEEKALFINEL